MSGCPQLLSHLLVIEYTSTVAGAYCGKVLADLGARVVKIEPPQGDPTRRRGPFPADVPNPETSGLFLYLNTNKQGRIVDMNVPTAEATLRPLLHTASILIDDTPAGQPQPAALRSALEQADNPQLVTVAVTHFGRCGPYASWRGSELTDFHMSGLGYLTPGNVDDPCEPPLKAPGFMAQQLAGLTAAVAALNGRAWAEMNDAPVTMDVSSMEASAAMMLINVPWLSYEGTSPSRMRGERRGVPLEPLPCADGWFTVLTVEPAQWSAWIEVMGRPAWATDPALNDRSVRSDRWEEIKAGVIEWASAHGKQEIADRGQARRVPVFPVNTVADLAACPQLEARRFFTTIDHPVAGALRYPGLPYHFEGPPHRPWRAAPRLGEDNDAPVVEQPEAPPRRAPARHGEGPLAGVRVADFSWVLAGPHCTKWLAAMGADVIRVETHRRLDQFRRSAPFADGVADPDRAGSFHAINFGKRSVTLDLTQEAATAYARDLIAVSDVVVENFAHGQMERFGLSPAVVRALRPDVIMASSSGLGRTGPLRAHVAYGNTIHAYAGLTGLTGLPGGAPRGVSTTYTDPLTGVTQCLAILAALRYRDRTGAGCDIDLSMAEATMALLPEAFMDYAMNGRIAAPEGNRDRQHAPQGVYPCAGEEHWLALTVRSEREWQSLCAALREPTWTTDQRFATAEARRDNHDALDELIAAATRGGDRAELVSQLQAAGIAAGPSMTVADLLADPHLAAREFFIAPDHPLTGARRLPGIPWRSEPAIGVSIASAPMVGQHTREVLVDLLGIDAAAVDQLIETRIAY